MNFVTIIVLVIFSLILLRTICGINIIEIKNIGENNKILDEEAERYPSNIDVCKSILKILKNENVRIQEEKSANTCLYIAISNKIIIANMRNSFTRIQTIAHECLHSVQDKKILLFNFIYSNFYNLYFIIIVILGLFNKIQEKLLFLTIYIILGFIYYFVRSYLENDAMIKARYLAKEYMEEQNISSKEKIEQIIMEYDKLNNLGIKATNYNLFFYIFLKVIILSIIMIF